MKRLVLTALTAILAAALLVGCASTTAEEPAAQQEQGAEGLVNSITADHGVLYTLYVGLVDKDTGAQELSFDEANAIVTPIIAQAGSGYTLIKAQGGYINEDGQLIENETLVYTSMHISEESLSALIDEIVLAVNNESVYVTSEYGAWGIYGGQIVSA